MKSYLVLLSLLVPSIAAAHITIASGPAVANKSGQKITFAINHGCEVSSTVHLDTLSIKVDVPAGIDATSVRGMSSDLDRSPAVAKTGTNITSVTWTKDPSDLLADDLGYYEVTLRLKVTDVPFTKIPFVITQVCRPQGGTAADDVTVVWTGPSTNAEPSPLLVVVPAHSLGWNKLTLTAGVAVADFGSYFGDSQIVWKGTSAFSPNMAVAALITMTSGVTSLASDLAAGDEIWVKY